MRIVAAFCRRAERNCRSERPVEFRGSTTHKRRETWGSAMVGRAPRRGETGERRKADRGDASALWISQYGQP